MCRSRDSLAFEPTRRSTTRTSRSRNSNAVPSISSISLDANLPTKADFISGTSTSTNSTNSSSSTIASLHCSLPEKPIIYSFAEIATATNNFLAKRISTSSSSSWLCSLRSHATVVFQRPFCGDPAAISAKLATACKCHHRNIAILLGASISIDRIFLVYNYVPGASLADCLRNKRNPSFTPLSSWISRIQIASDLAQGLEYIHHYSIGVGIVHNRIKSSAIIITEPQSNAVICHFSAAFLAGDVPEESSIPLNKMIRSHSISKKIEGSMGYLAPEVVAGSCVSRRSDVFAFGVLLLELISGMEPLTYKIDRIRKEYRCISVIDMAREAFGMMGLKEEEPKLDLAERRKIRIRQWVDERLKDSFPIEVVEKLMAIAFRCVELEVENRPSMTWVQGKISKLFLSSKIWAESVRVPTDFSVTIAPR